MFDSPFRGVASSVAGAFAKATADTFAVERRAMADKTARVYYAKMLRKWAVGGEYVFLRNEPTVFGGQNRG